MDKNAYSDVVLVTSDEKSINYKWENNSEKLKAIDVISADYGWKDGKFENFEFIGLIPNTEQVFLKSPFEKNTYVAIEKAEDDFFKKKISLYKKIVRKLGAKNFSAKAEFIEEKRISNEGSVNISYAPAADLSVSAKTEIENKIAKNYELEAKFQKDDEPFDRALGYKNAKEDLEKYNLQKEYDLVDLIEGCDPNEQNTYSSQIVKFELTAELNSLIELSANINVMGGVFELGTSFKQRTESLKKIVLRTEVNF